jgi:UDP-N-acetylmuramoylalanine--D-glutamate ligase
VLELTSSHLAFMRESPRVAAITCLWPDHLELHGSFAAYRAAKETIVRGQRPGDVIVVNADDPGAAAFAEITPASLVEVSLEHPVECGAFVRDGTIVLRWDDAQTVVGPLDLLAYAGRHGLNLCRLRSRCGRPPDCSGTPAGVELPAHVAAGWPRRRLPAIDDGMAATLAKTAATLAAYADGSVVLIAGGVDNRRRPVHAMPEERSWSAPATRSPAAPGSVPSGPAAAV